MLTRNEIVELRARAMVKHSTGTQGPDKLVPTPRGGMEDSKPKAMSTEEKSRLLKQKLVTMKDRCRSMSTVQIGEEIGAHYNVVSKLLKGLNINYKKRNKRAELERDILANKEWCRGRSIKEMRLRFNCESRLISYVLVKLKMN